MYAKELKSIGITDKGLLRKARMVKRLCLLRRHHALLYAAFLHFGGEEGLVAALGAIVGKRTASRGELCRVAAYIGISPEALCRNTRKREIVEARQVAMYMAKHNTKDSLAAIGQAIGGKDHATVSHACKTVDNMLCTSPAYRDKWLPLLLRGENTRWLAGKYQRQYFAESPEWEIMQSSPYGIQYRHQETGETRWGKPN